MATFQDINCASKHSLMATDAALFCKPPIYSLVLSLILNNSYYNLSESSNMAIHRLIHAYYSPIMVAQ